MADHQQAAVEAAEDALRADIWDGDPEDIPPTMECEAELDRRALLTMTVTEETHHQIETEATEALRDRLDKMEAVEA